MLQSSSPFGFQTCALIRAFISWWRCFLFLFSPFFQPSRPCRPSRPGVPPFERITSSFFFSPSRSGFPNTSMASPPLFLNKAIVQHSRPFSPPLLLPRNLGGHSPPRDFDFFQRMCLAGLFDNFQCSPPFFFYFSCGARNLWGRSFVSPGSCPVFSSFFIPIHPKSSREWCFPPPPSSHTDVGT